MPTIRPRPPQASNAALEQTPLFKAMLQSGNYDDTESLLDTYREMLARVATGENPEEVLAEEGFEPDFVYDLI